MTANGPRTFPFRYAMENVIFLSMAILFVFLLSSCGPAMCFFIGETRWRLLFTPLMPYKHNGKNHNGIIHVDLHGVLYSG